MYFGNLIVMYVFIISALPYTKSAPSDLYVDEEENDYDFGVTATTTIMEEDLELDPQIYDEDEVIEPTTFVPSKCNFSFTNAHLLIIRINWVQ